jgi:uncharacterized protein
MDYSFYGTFLLVKDAVDSLLSILLKIESSSAADTIGQASIHESMRPFSFQVYWSMQLVHKLVADAKGEPLHKLEDNLATLPKMIATAKEAQAAIASVERETVNKRQREDVAFPMGPTRPVVQAPLWEYAQGFAIPNIFFHIVTAYGIARKEGVELGKIDYLRDFGWKYYSAHLPETDEKN